MLYDDAEGGDNDGVGTNTVGGSDGRKQKTAAYNNSVPMSITAGNPQFIVQQGQSPLHLALPVVRRAGEFPNDYFHRTMASENTNTTEIWVYAKHQNYSTVAEHNWGLVINLSAARPTAMPTRLPSCGI